MIAVTPRIARRVTALIVLGGLVATSPSFAQKPAQTPPAKPTAPTTTAPATPTKPGQPAAPAPSSAAPSTSAPANAVVPPADYVIGPDDVLTIVFWREKDLGGDVTVRPDGKITLPLMNDVQAAGLTPDQLRKAVIEAAGRFVTDPNATIVVKAINSRKVYVTGQVNKPGTFPLTDQMTVLQMLALSGGLQEYADSQNILVMRTEQGQTKSFKFNYKDVRKGKNLQQNIMLKPGDTIVVP